MSTSDVSQLTAIIPTANQPPSVHRLVRSLRRGYPQLKILVAGAGSKPIQQQGVDSWQLPPGSSRSTGCNALLARVRTPYFLLIDEQCELPRGTQLATLLDLVATDKLDVAAGDLIASWKKFGLFVRRQPRPAHGWMEFTGNRLTLTRGYRNRGQGFWWCDLVGNFFVARTNKVRSLGGWDQELANDEREEFFVRGHRQGLRVGIVPEVSAWFWQQRNSSPSTEGGPDLKRLAVAKMGLLQLTDLEGRMTTAPRRTAAA